MTRKEKTGAILGSTMAGGMAGIAFYGHYNRRPWARTLTLVTSGMAVAISIVSIAIVVSQPATDAPAA